MPKSRRKMAQTKKRKQGRAPAPALPTPPRESMAAAVRPVAEAPRPPAPVRTGLRQSPSEQTLAGRRYPYVSSELRNIGILAAIVVVILVVLGLVLPR